RLEAAVEGGDEAAHRLGLARDDAGAVLAVGADRLDGARFHVQGELARVPERDVDADVGPLPTRSEKRGDERRRAAARRGGYELVAVERDPAALAGERGSDRRL